jgi:hypothetical protein
MTSWNKTVRTALSAAIILFFFFGTAPSALPGVTALKKEHSGIVRIKNTTEYPVVIFVENVDYWGRTYWGPIEIISSNSYMELPDMPEGIWLGARTKDGFYEWKPFQVVYTSGTRSQMFEYTLYPHKMDFSKGIYPSFNFQSSPKVLVEGPLIQPF